MIEVKKLVKVYRSKGKQVIGWTGKLWWVSVVEREILRKSQIIP
ncbi:hypothetical protein [Mesobacillus zeae]|nr:hypothetical protein [Mesobacillus zeae]